MAEAAFTRTSNDGSGPGALAPLARAWGRISSRFVAVLAVVTALLITVPFMIVTRTGGNIGEGLNVAGTAYAALIEGSLGVGINPLVNLDDIQVVLTLAENQDVTRRDLLTLSRQSSDLVDVGRRNVRNYAEVITRYETSGQLTDEGIDLLGQRIADMQVIGADELRKFSPLLLALAELPRSDVSNLAKTYALNDTLDDDQRAAIVAFVPAADGFNNDELLTVLKLINQYTILRLVRVYEQLLILDSLGLEPTDGDAEAFKAIHEITTDNATGVARVRELIQVEERFVAAGIIDINRLANELRLVGTLYAEGILTNDNVATALRDELPAAIDNNLIVLRPGNRVLIHRGEKETAAIIYSSNNTPDDASDDVPDTVYLRLGNRILLFFPASLEAMLTRAIPFVIAGLAVALGFKAGLFNIGAEGQLYIGATIAAWVGFDFAQALTALVQVFLILATALAALSWVTRFTQNGASVRPLDWVVGLAGIAIIVLAGGWAINLTGHAYLNRLQQFQTLPLVIHLPLVLIAGIIGGALWGFVPGALKAFTGAHEVINTIMLNFIAIRLVDWLIKSTNPVIFLDRTASAPRTPFIAQNATLPPFNTYATWLFFAAGLVTMGFWLWSRREQLRQTLRAAIKPLVWGLVVIAGGLFLRWVTVRGNLHLGLVIMILTVFFVDWFLERTTLGFELRTVGTNPDAARYAGMSVRWNTMLALTMSGALVGLAGTIEISGVQHNMQPAFFSGLGFDSIAVALLARNNPRNMIPAGLLWGALLTGAGLMQVRADISIDLVKIIQALIIMFIAADAIIRTVWRIPEATAEEKAATTFSKGWGG